MHFPRACVRRKPDRRKKEVSVQGVRIHFPVVLPLDIALFRAYPRFSRYVLAVQGMYAPGLAGLDREEAGRRAPG